MNNLHRELAPISAKAWAQIEEEASRTLKRHLCARRVVDVTGPGGMDLASVATGHQRQLKAPSDGILAAQRETKQLVELCVPFQLSRQAIDDVERGATDSDWMPVKQAARKLAYAEDQSVFEGYAEAAIQGIREGTSNPKISLPSSVQAYPPAIAQALSQLKLEGVNGPYALVLGADAFTKASGGNEDGYPIFHHLERMLDGGIHWAPGLKGGYVLTKRGGDFQLDIGQDIAIGYTSHSSTHVELYFIESYTFRVLTSEASVALTVA